MAQQYAQGKNVHQQSWTKDLFGCCTPVDACCLATFLPCLLYGRMSSRMQNPSDPSPSSCNGDCCLFCCVQSFTGCAWILVLMKRGDIRQRYGIEGGGCGDCMAAFCCHCCALVQQDEEVKTRGNMQPNVQGYVQNGGMAYQ